MHTSPKELMFTFASVRIKPALIVYKGKEERLSIKKRSSREASGVTLSDSSLRLSRRRFPRCLPDHEISGEDLRRDGTHVGYVFRCSKAGGGGLCRALTVAAAVVAHADGAAQEASCPAQVAGAGVGDVVVATDGLLGQHGDGAGGCAAHDAVGAVGLVGHAGVGTRAHHVGAGLCGERSVGKEAASRL